MTLSQAWEQEAKYLARENESIRVNTIERCAQVADDYYNTHQSNPADAIRALKDEQP